MVLLPDTLLSLLCAVPGPFYYATTVVLPGQYLQLNTPSDVDPDTLWTLAPRLDCPSYIPFIKGKRSLASSATSPLGGLRCAHNQHDRHTNNREVWWAPLYVLT